MEYALQLKESDVLTLPRAQVRALLRSGDGSAALLYLFLAEAGGEKKETEICAALHWSSGGFVRRGGTPARAGPAGETRKVEERLSAPPERRARRTAAATSPRRWSRTLPLPPCVRRWAKSSAG